MKLKLLLFFLSVFPCHGKEFLFDGTAGVVGKEALTIRKVRTQAALEKFWNKSKETLTLSPEELQKSTQKSLFEMMVYKELGEDAGNFGTELEARTFQKNNQKGREKEWNFLLRALKIKEGEAITILLRIRQVDRFLQKKIETFAPLIGEEDVELYFRSHLSEYGGKPLAEVRGDILRKIRKTATEEAFSEWSSGLQRRYDVAVLLP